MTGDPIAELKSPLGSLISVYAGRPSPGGFAALLSDLLKPLRHRAELLNRRVQKSVRADSERIHDLAEDLEADAAPGYAIFASDFDGVFRLEALAHNTPNVSTLGPRPYLRPLRAAPRALRSGIIVADRAKARTFVAFDGLVDEVGNPIDADIGKPNYGGFSGYAEHGVRAHAEEASARLWKGAGARLLKRHEHRAFDYLAIGGHEETVEEVARSLHTYLARLERVSFVANPDGVGLAALRSEIGALDEEVRRRRQVALADQVYETARSGGNAVLGLTATLDAVNAQAIEALVVAGQFTRSGVMCIECGYLARGGSTCPVCRAATFETDDVVGAIMDATVAAGGRIHQTEVATALDVEGVGALTRFPATALSAPL